MKKLFLGAMLSVVQLAFSQNRAPSAYLRYPSETAAGDIMVNKVSVHAPSPLYTYYCNLQWNAGGEGGGYCGMQEHPNGRNFIYSIWDPSNKQPITAAYAHPTTKVERFGGEGTGLRSMNFGIGWEEDVWYTFVTRTWGQSDHTMFGFWIFDEKGQKWTHLITMDYPVSNVRFNGVTGTFIEDWLGNGENAREIRHKDGWKRNAKTLEWKAFNSSRFNVVKNDLGAKNYEKNYNAGVKDGYYFMRTGGTTTPETGIDGALLSLPTTLAKPDYAVGEAKDFSKSVAKNQLSFSWGVNEARLPQFSYHIEVYDNPDFTGSPVLVKDEVLPHGRNLTLDTSTLKHGQDYYIEFYIIDIFDNQSSVYREKFTAITDYLGVENNVVNDEISVSPNPFEDKIYIKANNGNYEATLRDSSGRVVLSQTLKVSDVGVLYVAQNLPKGLYLLTLKQSNGEEKTYKMFKK
ncbi:MAG: DUF3472 domain-containing protein [Bergeyella zoohelcum]|nr:DUF3472 domain-containing protein [Bergeyella zoohelcum]